MSLSDITVRKANGDKELWVIEAIQLVHDGIDVAVRVGDFGRMQEIKQMCWSLLSFVSRFTHRRVTDPVPDELWEIVKKLNRLVERAK